MRSTASGMRCGLIRRCKWPRYAQNLAPLSSKRLASGSGRSGPARDTCDDCAGALEQPVTVQIPPRRCCCRVPTLTGNSHRSCVRFCPTHRACDGSVPCRSRRESGSRECSWTTRAPCVCTTNPVVRATRHADGAGADGMVFVQCADAPQRSGFWWRKRNVAEHHEDWAVDGHVDVATDEVDVMSYHVSVEALDKRYG